jgi:hypothetical protein
MNIKAIELHGITKKKAFVKTMCSKFHSFLLESYMA